MYKDRCEIFAYIAMTYFLEISRVTLNIVIKSYDEIYQNIYIEIK